MVAAPAALADGWGTPINAAPGTGIPTEKTVAGVDTAGGVVAAWRRHDGQHWRVQASERTATGSFGSAQTLSTAGIDSDTPLAGAADNGEAVVAWLDGDQVRAAQRPAGGSLGSPVNVSATGASKPALAVSDNGLAILTWVRGGAVQAAVKPAGAQTFTAPLTLGTGAAPAVAASGANGVVAWTTGTAVQAARWTNDAFMSAEDVSAPSAGNTARAAIDGAGRITIAWLLPPTDALVARTTASVTGPFSASPVDLSDPGYAVHNVSVAAAKDTTVVAWSGTPNGSSDWVEANVRHGADPFSAQAKLDEAGFGPVQVAAAVDGNGVGTVAWPGPGLDYDSFAARIPAGGAPGPKTKLPFDPNTDIRLLAARGAQTVVAGTRGYQRPASQIPQVVGWDDTAPELHGFTIPSSVTTADSSGFTVTPFDWSEVFTRWDFGDGGTAVGAATAYRYPRPGAYTVTVTMTDAFGLTSRHFQSITVSPAPAQPATRLGGSVLASWRVRGSRTTLRRLRLSNIPAGAGVRLVCSGKGCPWKRKSVRVRRGAANGLSAAGKHRTFRAGSRLEIRITRAGATGRVVRYTFRRGRQPKRSVLCLPSGASSARRC